MAKIAVLGGAGFIGSHLCDKLIEVGHDVTAVDDLSSGSLENIAHLSSSKNFSFLQSDISSGIPIDGPVNIVVNLASIASPPQYTKRKVHTLRAGSAGTENALALAREYDARLIMASTSEIYGDPTVHPQPEWYWGSVNPVGPRSCYDEAKRFSEALCFAYAEEYGVDTGILRLFNTYGPRLNSGDGRVISNFVFQAISGLPLTVNGDGSQTRSFCYIDDTIDAILRMIDSKHRGPINIGNPEEVTILELAHIVKAVAGSRSSVKFTRLPEDDPTRRCPEIALAAHLLDWRPVTNLEKGLAKTIRWFRQQR